jgi:hypothetical protein
VSAIWEGWADRAEDRRQETGDRIQNTEYRIQETGDRRQETECGLATNSRRAGICAAFRLCFDVDFDIDHLLPMYRDLRYFVRCILYIIEGWMSSEFSLCATEGHRAHREKAGLLKSDYGGVV